MAQRPNSRMDALLTDLCSTQGWCDALRQPAEIEKAVPDGADAVTGAILLAEGVERSRVDRATQARITEAVNDWLFDPDGRGARFDRPS